jgi:hypothetical protein
MASIIKVDTIQTAAGGTPTAVDLGINTTGNVLQVVQQTYSTQTSGLSTSFSDTGLSASITPSSTSSKILVIVSQSHYLARQTNAPILMYARLLRDSTVVFSHDRCMGFNAGTAANGYIELYTTNNISHLDSPSTTSSLTYKTQVSLQTTNNNGGEASQPNNQPSTITLLEIAG